MSKYRPKDTQSLKALLKGSPCFHVTHPCVRDEKLASARMNKSYIGGQQVSATRTEQRGSVTSLGLFTGSTLGFDAYMTTVTTGPGRLVPGCQWLLCSTCPCLYRSVGPHCTGVYHTEQHLPTGHHLRLEKVCKSLHFGDLLEGAGRGTRYSRYCEDQEIQGETRGCQTW